MTTHHSTNEDPLRGQHGMLSSSLGPSLLRFVRWLSGSTAALQLATFRTNSRDLRFVLPGDSAWVAVKDNFLLPSYAVEDSAQGGTVIDAGAHVGTFALVTSLAAGRVIALEPNPDNLRLLKANIELNGAANVEVHSEALWGSSDGQNLDLTRDSSGGMLTGGSEGLRVKTTTLDELVDRFGPVEVLKLDIEGAEFPVVASASVDTLRMIDSIVGELHVFAVDDVEVAGFVEKLETAGFDVDIRRLPIYEPAKALRALLHNWRRTEGFTRLKITVAIAYLLTPLLDPLFGIRREFGGDALRMLSARRRAPA